MQNKLLDNTSKIIPILVVLICITGLLGLSNTTNTAKFIIGFLRGASFGVMLILLILNVQITKGKKNI
jgi:uncharacterized membrane protein